MSATNEFMYSKNGNARRRNADNVSDGPRLEEEKPGAGRKVLGCLRTNLLVIFLIIAMILGILIGLLIRKYHPDFTHDKRRRMYLKFCGDLLLNMLKMIILPLVFTSLVAGMANLPSQSAGKVGGRAVAYYMLTTFLAVLLGLLLVTTIKPGDRGDDRIDKTDRNTVLKPSDAILDLVRNMFPPNLIQACVEQAKTKYDTEDELKLRNVSFFNNVTNMTEMRPENYTEKIITDFNVEWKSGTNILGIVLFSIVLGLVIGRMGPEGRTLHIFFDRFQNAIIQIVHMIIWFSPIGVMCLLAERIVRMEDPAKSFEQLTYYMLTVLLGLFIHAVIFLPAIYFFFTRSNPFKMAMHMGEALLTAWGTASSAATLPVTVKCIEEKAGVHKTISRFVLPVGATINMDGTALYEAVAAIFIAQYNDIELDAGQIVTTAITATLAAIGAAGVPEGGLVTMIIVLTAVGLPVDDIGLIYAVDWFLDRFRTATNVWGDSVGARIVEHLSQRELADMEEKNQNMEPVVDPSGEVYVVDRPYQNTAM